MADRGRLRGETEMKIFTTQLPILMNSTLNSNINLRENSNTKRFLNFSECCEDGNSPLIFVSIGKQLVLLVKRVYCA